MRSATPLASYGINNNNKKTYAMRAGAASSNKTG